MQVFEFLFATQLNKRTDVIDIIYMWTLPKEENKTTPVLTFLGTRFRFYLFISVHTDMCAALLLF